MRRHFIAIPVLASVVAMTATPSGTSLAAGTPGHPTTARGAAPTAADEHFRAQLRTYFGQLDAAVTSMGGARSRSSVAHGQTRQWHYALRMARAQVSHLNRAQLEA